MNCITCGVKTFASTTTDVTDLGMCLIIIRSVPCHKCSECNEIIYTADVVKSLEKMIETAKHAMTGIAIIDFKDEAA